MREIVLISIVSVLGIHHLLDQPSESGADGTRLSTETGDVAEEEIVRAKRFELLDEEDRVRIELTMEDGNPVIHLKDGEERDRISIFHQEDATGIYLKDAELHTRVGLAQFAHGGGLALHGEESKGAAVFVLMNDEARMDVYNQAGELTDRWPEGDDQN